MDIPPSRLVRLLLPRLPTMLRIMLTNKLSLSPNSDKQDLQTELTVTIIRSILSASNRSLKFIQDGSLKDPGIKGKMLIAKTSILAPDTTVRDLVVQAIKYLGNGSETFDLPDLCDVEGEWTGYRADAEKTTPRFEGSEAVQYKNLMKEVSSPVTVLYFHGGAYLMMDPASHRNVTVRLAELTKGRCFSVRYRLAPQSPFPAQILDALISYLYLLSPPTQSGSGNTGAGVDEQNGVFHDAVSPTNIIFAGDSAGGNLSLVLTLLLLTLKKMGIESIPFHGRSVPIVLPAGIATNSPWCDIGRGMPTIHTNARLDYLDPPSATGMPSKTFPDDEIWPATPPRAEIYCNANMLSHPLASPAFATIDMWRDAPPFFACVGNEGLEDEILVTTRRLAQAGVKVDFIGYEGMPHCFAMIFPTTPAGKDCFDRWSRFCIEHAGSTSTSTSTSTSAIDGDKSVTKNDTGLWMKAFSNPLQFREVKLTEMGISDTQVEEIMNRTRESAIRREKDAVQAAAAATAGNKSNNGSKAKL